jgi:hypothetical protein
MYLELEKITSAGAIKLRKNMKGCRKLLKSFIPKSIDGELDLVPCVYFDFMGDYTYYRAFPTEKLRDDFYRELMKVLNG